MLRIEGISKNFLINKSFWQLRKEAIRNKQQQQYLKAVDNVSFELERGKVLVIAGESGSGKTTLAKLVMGAIKPDSGSIFFDGQLVSNLAGSELKRFRSQVHMVYQDPYASLDPHMRIADIVMEPLNIHNKERSTKQQKMEKVFKALEEVRLEPKETIAARFPHELSGGQRQRVALARAIVLKPKLIVADEPVSMLDVSVRAEILALMMNLKERFEISFIYITHDLSTARYVGNHIIIMYRGQIVEKGDIDKVLLNPLHPYTQALIQAIPDSDNIFAPQEEEEEKDEDKDVVVHNNNTRTGIRTAADHFKKTYHHNEPPKGAEFLSTTTTTTSTSGGCNYYKRCPYSMEVCKKPPTLAKVEDSHYASCFLYEGRN